MPATAKHLRMMGWKPLILALALALPATQANGQETQGRDPALPDLAPREVEIRGQLEITFPSLKRQPLIGFNPPPRIPEIPLDRRPYIEPYKQESADLPPSPLQPPEPPPVTSLPGATPNRGEFEALAGRYLNRVVRVRAATAPTGPAVLSARLDYRGSDGFTPFKETLPDVRNPFDALEGSFEVRTQNKVVASGVTLQGFFENYSLYGVRSPVRSLFVPIPDREGRGADASLWVRTRETSSLDLDARLRYGATRYQTDVFADPSNEDPNFTRVEGRLDLEANMALPLASGKLLLDGRTTASGLDSGSLLGSTVRSFTAGGAYRFLYGDAYHVRLGLRVMAFEARGQTPTGATRRASYVAPDFRIDLYPQTGLALYVRNRPGLEQLSLADLYRENPYLIDQPRIQPTLHTVNAEVGIRYFYGRFQIAGKAGYEEAPNYLYFERDTGEGLGAYTEGLSATRYGKARILRVGGESSLVLTTRLHASLGLEIRKGRLTELDVDIPYFAPITGTAMLSYLFGGGDGLVQVSTTFESPRYRSRERVAEDRVGTYINLDVEASYQVTPWIGIVGRAENLIGGRLTRWDNYPEVPTSVLAGLRIRF